MCKLKTIWGKNTIRETIQYISKIGKGKTIIAYNGSRFDFYFILNELKRQGSLFIIHF